MIKVITYPVVLLAAALLWPKLAPSAVVPTKPATVPLTSDEVLMVSCINSERESRGLPALSVDPLLVEVARQHSADMAKRKYFSHIAPEPLPRTPIDRYGAALGRPPATVVGENLGCCDQPIMWLIHRGMMASTDHKANILDREYVSVGVGVHVLADGQVWVTQMFRGELPKVGVGE